MDALHDAAESAPVYCHQLQYRPRGVCARPRIANHKPRLQTRQGEAQPARSCPEAYPVFDPLWTVAGSGPLGGFRLSVEQRAYALGDTVTCTLRNTTQEPRVTGDPDQYDVQYRGEAGWQTIYTTPHDDVEWASFGVNHDPGTGFTWEFPLTRTGLSNVVPDNTKYVLCAPIQPGDYRFVYWGITPDIATDEPTMDVAPGRPLHRHRSGPQRTAVHYPCKPLECAQRRPMEVYVSDSRPD